MRSYTRKCLETISTSGVFVTALCLSQSGLTHEPAIDANSDNPPQQISKTKDQVKAEMEAKAAAGASAAGGGATDDWAITLSPDQDIQAVADSLGADSYTQVGNLKNTFVLTIPDSRGDAAATREALNNMPGVSNVQQQVLWTHKKLTPTDPLFGSQWHLDKNNDTNFSSPIGARTPGVDANVANAWSTEGVDGTGVTIGIVDDGLQHTHPDLSPNYNPDASWDYNAGNSDPAPNNLATDRHGTAVGGVSAAADDGSKCGAGAAFNATLAGLQLIAGPVSDATIASALAYGQTGVPDKAEIDIYNNSWGPGDSGAGALAFFGPGPITRWIMADGAINGRNGKGLIYVWAAGNGRTDNDNANYDNYTNQRYTIAVGSVRATLNDGQYSFYSEPGAALHISAPSNNWAGEGIRTTDLLGDNGYNSSVAPDTSGDTDCTDSFGGTSSAAPLVAGIIGLMLEANPNLGWRDVQHILAETAVKNDPADPDWTVNGDGFNINHNYGFGMIDAQAAVASAKTWINKPAVESVSSGVVNVNTAIPDGLGAGVFGAPVMDTITISDPDDELILEHVEVVFNATHTYRGDLELVLTSPEGTQSVLAAQRVQDPGDHYSWTFMTVRNWGESSLGDWTLSVRDGYNGDAGTFDSWELNTYGTPPGC